MSELLPPVDGLTGGKSHGAEGRSHRDVEDATATTEDGGRAKAEAGGGAWQIRLVWRRQVVAPSRSVRRGRELSGLVREFVGAKDQSG